MVQIIFKTQVYQHLKIFKKLFSLVILSLFLLTSPAWSDTDTEEEQCVDKNPKTLIDLGGSLKPETIVYATYDSCTQKHDYCGSRGCDLTVYGNEDTEGLISYIAKDLWYIRPARVYGKDPTYELVVPLNGRTIVINVVDDKLTETTIDEDCIRCEGN